MSQWRRRALQEVPACKITIETAADPNHLWIDLWHEFLSAHEAKPPQQETIRQIYRFANQCSREPIKEPLAGAVWLFFDYLVGAFVVENPPIVESLPSLMSIEEFQRRLETYREMYGPDERIANARKRFAEAMRKAR